jgi:hypothetical protein
MDDISSDVSLSTLAKLPSDRPISLVMRHAPRVNINNYSEVYVAGLTPEGEAAAQDFGARLAQIRSVGQIVSSPVSRCVNTALAIAHGAGWQQFVRVDDRISHPFISPVWLLLSNLRFPDTPIPAELVTLLKFVTAGSSETGRVDIFVTHDTVVGSLGGYFTGLPASDGNIPNFFEAVFVWREGPACKILWRDMTSSINFAVLDA